MMQEECKDDSMLKNIDEKPLSRRTGENGKDCLKIHSPLMPLIYVGSLHNILKIPSIFYSILLQLRTSNKNEL